ncbi:MAG: Phospho-N-acetylmuramoyl-pentapeptide-transferase, partial [Parcubacteria group bacterium GW2011_GWC1_43_11b]|uniref:Phospho-N-acetylmuramoyl-pentapeptide-transferase n=2 Tax=Candidatus Vogeliibacteriota TaxID=1817922 RepID=A0A1G2QI21_9BACT
MNIDIIKVLGPSAFAFFIGILITPILTNYLYKNRMWKKKAGKISPDGRETPIFNSLHKEKETGTPRMGGIIIWVSALATVMIFWLLAEFWPTVGTAKMNFLSRNQTWLPLFTLLVGSIVGLIDDLMQVREGIDPKKAGLPFFNRLLVVIALGLAGGWWFYAKLGMVAITVPFGGSLFVGWLIIPLFILVMMALFSSGVIDGLDGLAGGIMAIIFTAYTFIAYFQNQVDLATFCAVITGGTLAFLWFNIPPARFYMSETGILGLTTALTVVAFLTDTVLILPIIALPLLATSLSVVIQLVSKKLRNGKKVFLVAPLHHHFEALGWPSYKVVMRYWVISIIAAILGMIMALVSQ